jgi:CheY-like chemotaxis protein
MSNFARIALKILPLLPSNTVITLFTSRPSKLIIYCMRRSIDSPNSNPGGKDKLRVLIVEDNGLFRQAFRNALQLSFPGIIVDESTNGAMLLQTIQASYPDLIFMDIRLPGESGLVLTQKIKEAYLDIIVFILSNYDIPEYRDAAFRYGADHFIAKKSFNRMRLEELVRSFYKI